MPVWVDVDHAPNHMGFARPGNPQPRGVARAIVKILCGQAEGFYSAGGVSGGVGNARRRVVAVVSGAAATQVVGGLGSGFFSWAEREPDRIALDVAGQTMTYGGLAQGAGFAP